MQKIKMHFMHEALAMGRVAVEKGEIPVGCIIVESCHLSKTNTIIARGSNETNESRNGTRHAEIVAVESLFSSIESNTSRIDESDMLGMFIIYSY
jgi:tRNA-specific adenosine deaminase 2